MADTSKNIGRRANPVCENEWCARRVDVPGDTICNGCRYGNEKHREARRYTARTVKRKKPV